MNETFYWTPSLLHLIHRKEQDMDFWEFYEIYHNASDDVKFQIEEFVYTLAKDAIFPSEEARSASIAQEFS